MTDGGQISFAVAGIGNLPIGNLPIGNLQSLAVSYYVPPIYLSSQVRVRFEVRDTCSQ